MKIHTQRQLLEMALDKHKINYTELAKLLGVSRQRISQAKFGDPLPFERAMKLAKLLPELNANYIYLCIEHSKALRVEDVAKARNLAHLAEQQYQL